MSGRQVFAGISSFGVKAVSQVVSTEATDFFVVFSQGKPHLERSQRYQEGLSYLEKAQRMTPDSWATYFYMGKAQFQQHDTAAAVRLLRQAVEMNPEDPGSFYLFARALRSEGHVQEAEAAMQHVVQLHISSLDAEKRALKDAGVVGAR